MKLYQMWVSVCEGCGRTWISEDSKACAGIPPHVTPNGDSVVSEEECIKLAEERRRTAEQLKKKIQQEKKKLINISSTHPKFVELVALFPEEDGYGETWSAFARILRQIARESNVELEQLTYSSCAFHNLLSECIKNARMRQQV